MKLADITDFLKPFIGGQGPALEDLPVKELAPRVREAKGAAVASVVALKRLEECDLAGLADDDVAKHAAALELARLTVKRDSHNVAAIEAALTIAREREAEAAAEDEAAALADGRLRDAVDEGLTALQQADALRLQVARLLERACSPAVRMRLSRDPTAGLRPTIQRLLGDRMPPVAREIFASGQTLPLGKPGPHAGDKRLAREVGKPPRRETFIEGRGWTPDRSQTVTRGDA